MWNYFKLKIWYYHGSTATPHSEKKGNQTEDIALVFHCDLLAALQEYIPYTSIHIQKEPRTPLVWKLDIKLPTDGVDEAATLKICNVKKRVWFFWSKAQQ